MTLTPDLTTTDVGTALDRYRTMREIRSCEEAAATLYAAGEIPGFVHLSVGQEAVAAGVCAALDQTDVITSTHRGHGHVLAKGIEPHGMFAELMGRATGTCGGFGGSMHIADPHRGVFGANGIVGAGLPIAGGAAFSMRLRSQSRVAVCFFGDGAVNTGAWHEAANLISLWRLPVLLVCENNGVSEFSRTEDQHPVGFAERAKGYGIEHVRVDGNDVDVVHAAAERLVAGIRSGGPPVLLEAMTHRIRGHYEGDPQRYRDPVPVPDPLERARVRLVARAGEETLARIDDEITADVTAAIEAARAAPYPQKSRMLELGDVRSVVADHAATAEEHLDGTRQSGSRSVRAALRDALAEDERVFLAGIDVGAGGGVFGASRGLAEEFPGRVLDTPISESAILGLAVGAAMDGLRPVVELMYLDFIGVCLDQLMNQAAKLPFMTGGATTVPMVLRTQFGVGRSSGSQHSQSLEAMLAHIPGLVVAMPATPEDMYGMIRSAIELPAPVVVIENRLIYEKKGRLPRPAHRTPLGKARVARPGRDVTIVTASRALQTATEAAEQLAAEGIECEIVDLRTIAPLDHETVLASLERTSRLLIVTEGVTDFGVGAEIAARAVDAGFWTLDAPVRRLSGPPTPVPYSPVLEQAWLPTADDIVREVRDLCRDAF